MVALTVENMFNYLKDTLEIFGFLSNLFVLFIVISFTLSLLPIHVRHLLYQTYNQKQPNGRWFSLTVNGNS